MEFAEHLVVTRHRTLALQDDDFDRRLVVGCGGECLALAGRYGGVGIDKLCHHTAEGFNAYRQGHYVEQKHVLDIAAEHTALDGSTYGYDFVGIDTL